MPERVAIETLAPELRPSSAVGFEVVTLNSCTLSGLSRKRLFVGFGLVDSLASIPSIVTFTAVDRAPLTFTVLPERCVTPGSYMSRLSGFRPLSGSETIDFCSITLPRVAVAVCRISEEAVTCTLSAAVPTSSRRSTTAGVPTWTVLLVRVTVLKPVASTFTL